MGHYVIFLPSAIKVTKLLTPVPFAGRIKKVILLEKPVESGSQKRFVISKSSKLRCWREHALSRMEICFEGTGKLFDFIRKAPNIRHVDVLI